VPSIGSGSRVPPGGASGSFLSKKSSTDFDLQWGSGPVGVKGDPGDPGTPGSDGVTPTFSVGTVNTLSAGASATVTQTGTQTAPVLNFGIPQGAAGASGSGGSGSFVSSAKWGSD
jgi:hypothetical protein